MAYIYSGGQKFEVEIEVKRAIDNLGGAVRRRATNAGECPGGKKMAVHCEGDCISCKYRRVRTASVEELALLPHTTIADPDGNSQFRLSELCIIMQRVDLDGERIAHMYVGGMTDAEIARELGIPASTYQYRKQKIKLALEKALR